MGGADSNETEYSMGLKGKVLTFERVCIEGICNCWKRWNGSITLVHHLGDVYVKPTFDVLPGSDVVRQAVHTGNLTNPWLNFRLVQMYNAAICVE